MPTRKPISLPRLNDIRARGDKITMLTAYDATFAAVADAAAPEVAAPAAASPAAPAKPEAAPAEEEPSFLDAVGGLSTLLLAGAFLLLAGGLGYGYVRRRRDAASADFDVAEATTVRDDFFQQTGTLPAPVRPPAAHMEVLENPVTQHAPPVVRPRPPTRNAEDTLSGESAIDLDKADAITEANWHVAYGLYDQAAETLRLALRTEPERRDLKVKLLEVYFVWGKAELFLELARNLGQTRAQGGPGGWAAKARRRSARARC
jgi:Tfp pilus assembly protein FimV